MGRSRTWPPRPLRALILNQVVGAVTAVAASPTNSNILYVGTANGGIWRTNDATDPNPIWTPLTDNMASLSIGSLAFDPTDASGQTLVAGVARTSEYGRAGGLLTGILRTTDGGATWTQLDGGGILDGKDCHRGRRARKHDPGGGGQRRIGQLFRRGHLPQHRRRRHLHADLQKQRRGHGPARRHRLRPGRRSHQSQRLLHGRDRRRHLRRRQRNLQVHQCRGHVDESQHRGGGLVSCPASGRRDDAPSQDQRRQRGPGLRGHRQFDERTDEPRPIGRGVPLRQRRNEPGRGWICPPPSTAA